MTGARYETCRECGLEWNVSRQAAIPWSGYLCPRCRGKRRKEAQGREDILACKLHRWNRTRRVVNRIRKDFKLLAHGEVLDKAAGRYNLIRKPGETDKALRERILKTIKEVRTT